LSIVSRLRSTLIIRKNLKNWIAAGFALARNREDVNLLFRDGTRILNVKNQTALVLILGYCKYSHHLGVYSSSDLLELNHIAKDISAKLSAVFTNDGIGKYGTGGYFGEKESLLFTIVRKFKPSTIVETGVAQGVSSYVILKALQLNGQGKLISIDRPNRDPRGYRYHNGTLDCVFTPSHLKSGWLVPEELRKFWALELGTSSEILPTLSGSIDMFFHDSEHSYENMMFEFDWAYAHLGNGGILMSDDIDWNRAFRDFAEKHNDMKTILDRGLLIKSKNN
jgi:predicted O-methyltransferase YrrM